ncbi:MAG: 30S ribosomal protein S14 [Chlamydiae bacterium]|nr:30S ribosomal protein S14 [Chlamydiota bacterium]
MAKTSSIVKQKRRERLVKNTWEKRNALKKIASNVKKTEEERANARTALDKMPKNTSPQRLRNRCQLTGRSRGYLRKFKLSRLSFRELANAGMIPGIVKASW